LTGILSVLNFNIDRDTFRGDNRLFYAEPYKIQKKQTAARNVALNFPGYETMRS